MKKFVLFGLGLAFILTSSLSIADGEEKIQKITLKPGSSIIIEPLVRTEVVAESIDSNLPSCRLVKNSSDNRYFIYIDNEVIAVTNNYNDVDVSFDEALKKIKKLKDAGLCR